MILEFELEEVILMLLLKEKEVVEGGRSLEGVGKRILLLDLERDD